MESIYYLKKKMDEGKVELTNESNQQNNGKWILGGGLIIILLVIAVSGFLLLFKKTTPPNKSGISNIIPTATPSKILPSPTPNQVVYNFPTVTGFLPSPTLVTMVTVIPTQIPKPTKLPSPTIKPSPTSSPSLIPSIPLTLTTHPTKTPIPTSIPTVQLSVTPSPTKILPIGGPAIMSPTINQVSPTSAVVIVPKMPVSGSIQQTLSILFLGVSTVLAGILL